MPLLLISKSVMPHAISFFSESVKSTFNGLEYSTVLSAQVRYSGLFLERDFSSFPHPFPTFLIFANITQHGSICHTPNGQIASGYAYQTGFRITSNRFPQRPRNLIPHRPRNRIPHNMPTNRILEKMSICKMRFYRYFFQRLGFGCKCFN